MGGIAGDGLWRSDRTRPSPRGHLRGPWPLRTVPAQLRVPYSMCLVGGCAGRLPEPACFGLPGTAQKGAEQCGLGEPTTSPLVA
jgi:hypothetical protein